MLDLSEVFRIQAKAGNSHFHAYASYRGQRYTLALAMVERGEKMEAVLKRLLARLARLGIATRLLLLDRGFRAWRSSAACRRPASRS